MNGGEQSVRNLLNEKLGALSGAMRLGSEACQKGSLEAVAMHIVNNTRMLARFDRSCLADCRGGSPEIVAVMGAAEVNRNSEFCVDMKRLLTPLRGLRKSLVLREEALKELNAPESALEAFKKFKAKSEDVIVVPLLPPDASDSFDKGCFLWVLEFHENMGTDTEKLLILLSQLYAVAAWHSVRRRRSPLSAAFQGEGSYITPGRALTAAALLLAILLFAVRVDMSALADFQLEPSEKTVEYAPFAGVLKKPFVANGQSVKKGERMLEYDSDELKYGLLASQKEYDELGAQLDMVRQNSFVNAEDLAKIKLLEAKRERKKVDIDLARWRLSKSVLLADRDGVVAIDDPNLLAGRSVNAGAELYQILPPGRMIAKALLNESDAAALSPDMKIKLYLHSSPATALKAEPLSVSPLPTLQESKKFCYVVKAKIEGAPEGLLCGMRGVAKISGKRVSLGYYLFRNALLWWRKI